MKPDQGNRMQISMNKLQIEASNTEKNKVEKIYVVKITMT